MKTPKEITIDYLRSIHKDLCNVIINSSLGRRDQSLVNLHHKLNYIEKTIDFVIKSEKEQ